MTLINIFKMMKADRYTQDGREKNQQGTGS